MTTESTKALSDAAERVRDANHAGGHHSAYTYPNEVYDTYAALAILAERLPQAIHQSAGWIATETDRGGIRIVSGEFIDDPQAAAAAVEHHSGQAAGALLTALHELNAAHNIVAAMATLHQEGEQ